VHDTNELNQIPFKRELYRKLTHIGALVIPVGYYFINRTDTLAIMISVTVVMIIIDIARLRGWRLWDLVKPLIAPIIREHEIQGDFTGATYILSTATLTILLFAKPIAIAALVFIIVGDSAAALIGRIYGKHKIGNRSLEGSLAFLAVSILVAYMIPDLAVGIGLIGAVVATITEALSFKIDDNATVPLVSGLFMHLAKHLFFT
jgi:dolichol kinase